MTGYARQSAIGGSVICLQAHIRFSVPACPSLEYRCQTAPASLAGSDRTALFINQALHSRFARYPLASLCIQSTRERLSLFPVYKKEAQAFPCAPRRCFFLPMRCKNKEWCFFLEKQRKVNKRERESTRTLTLERFLRVASSDLRLAWLRIPMSETKNDWI